MTGWLQEWDKGKTFVDNHIKDFKALDTIANAQYSGGSQKNPPIGDTTRPQEFEKLKDTKTVQAGKFQYMFGFESYDSKYINDFDTIGESIMMGHREDGEKL